MLIHSPSPPLHWFCLSRSLPPPCTPAIGEIDLLQPCHLQPGWQRQLQSAWLPGQVAVLLQLTEHSGPVGSSHHIFIFWVMDQTQSVLLIDIHNQIFHTTITLWYYYLLGLWWPIIFDVLIDIDIHNQILYSTITIWYYNLLGLQLPIIFDVLIDIYSLQII